MFDLARTRPVESSLQDTSAVRLTRREPGEAGHLTVSSSSDTLLYSNTVFPGAWNLVMDLPKTATRTGYCSHRMEIKPKSIADSNLDFNSTNTL